MGRIYLVMLFAFSSVFAKEVIQVEGNELILERSYLNDEEIIEVFFSEPGGKLFWLPDCENPNLYIGGDIICHGSLEFVSPKNILFTSWTVLTEGTITINAQGSIKVKGGAFESRGHNISFLAKNQIYISNASIDSGWNTEAGNIYIGGGLHGEDPNIQNASAVFINRGTQIYTDAYMKGPGGDVVIWSDYSTIFHGSIKCQSHRKGNVEVASKGWLHFDGEVEISWKEGMLKEVYNTPLSGAYIDGLWLGQR